MHISVVSELFIFNIFSLTASKCDFLMNSWLSQVRGTFIIRKSEFSNNTLINQVNEVLLDETIITKSLLKELKSVAKSYDPFNKAKNPAFP